MFGEVSDALPEDMWSLSPTSSDAQESYYRVDFKSTDLNILSESLQRLDANTRELRNELSLHTELVHTFVANLGSIVRSELTESLNNLLRCVSKVEDEIDLVARQELLAPDYRVGANARDSVVLPHRYVRRGRSSCSLDRFSRSDKRSSVMNYVRFRSHSVESFFSPCQWTVDTTKLDSVFQSWLIQRIQVEMKKRHEIEALLLKKQAELERLRATEMESLSLIGNEVKRTNITSNETDVDEEKIHAVHKYLFDSIHCNQLPLKDRSSFLSSPINPTKFTNCEEYRNLDVTSRSRTHSRPLSRHFSEPDLIISCHSSDQCMHFPTHLEVTVPSNPVGYRCRSKILSPWFSFAPRQCKSYSTLDSSRSSALTNPDSVIYSLFDFLRQSSSLFMLLKWHEEKILSGWSYNESDLFLCVRRFGEHLERFRSSVLQTRTTGTTDPCGCLPDSLFPLLLCDLLHLSNKFGPRTKEENEMFPKRNHVDSFAEETVSPVAPNTNRNVISFFWQGVSEIFPSNDNCFSPDNVLETLVTRLNAMDQKLREQIEQCNELEALLAERDARIAAQASELVETEAHLAASAETVASLHKQILSSNRNWTHVLQQIQNQMNFNPSEPSVDQLPALPAVLDLVRNLDAAYAELQESERCRTLAEQRATSALITARRLRCQLRDSQARPVESNTLVELNEHILTDRESQTDSLPSTKLPVGPLKQTSHEIGVQSPAVEEIGTNCVQGKESTPHTEVLKFGFSLPRTALEQAHTRSSVDQVSELREALKNAVAQVDRLQTYRATQKSRYEQLQQRFLQMNSELDATVDALRHHQTSSEVERRRAAVELAQLRTQLAKANSLLDHYKMLQTKLGSPFPSPSTDRVLPIPNETGERSISSGSSPVGKNRPDLLPSCSADDLALQLSVTRNELSQLKSDMTEQKATADREATNLRGRLAEATADVRSLRLQLNRLQSVGSTSRAVLPSSGEDLGPMSCSNCQRLQRLLDLLQAKYRLDADTALSTARVCVAHEPSENIPLRAKCDHSCQADVNTEEVIRIDPDNSTGSQLERRQNELNEFEKALRDKDLELQKESGRLSFEADRLKRKQDSIAYRESKLQEDIELHESQIESQRVELQNDMLQLSRERTALAHERQALESERAHLHVSQMELKQKRREAELLIELAAKEHAAASQGTKNSLCQKGLHTAEFSDMPVAAHQRSTSPLTLESSETHSQIYSQNSENSLSAPQSLATSDKFEQSAALLLSWLEKSLHHLDAKLLFQHSDRFDADPDVFVSRLLEFLKSNLRRMHAQWSKNCGTLPEPTVAAEGTQSVSVRRTVLQCPVNEVDTKTEQLLKRLRAAEKEAQEATEQLKASNTEFLNLRERISYAMVERAHLKATVDGLDEEVTRLRGSLYERTQQLGACQIELARYTGRVNIPMPSDWHSTVKETSMSGNNLNLNPGLHIANPEATVITLDPASVESSCLSGTLQNFRIWSYQRLDHIRHRVMGRSSPCQFLLQFVNAISLARFRLHSQPRPRLIFGFLIYLLFVHFLLLRYWLA